MSPAAKEGDILTVTATDVAGNTSVEATIRVGLLRVVAVSTTVTVGQEQVIRVENLQPSEEAKATIHSTPFDLGAKVSDGNGTTVYTWIPGADDVGVHTVTATGPISGEATSSQFTVIPAVVPRTETVRPTPTTTVTIPGPTPTVTARVTHPATGAQTAAALAPWATGGVGLGLLLVLLGLARRRRQV